MKAQLNFLKQDRKLLMVLKSKVFPIGTQTQQKGRPLDLACVVKVSNHILIKVLTPEQMLQKLPIALSQVKAGNTSEELINKIKQSKFLQKHITI